MIGASRWQLLELEVEHVLRRVAVAGEVNELRADRGGDELGRVHLRVTRTVEGRVTERDESTALEHGSTIHVRAHSWRQGGLPWCVRLRAMTEQAPELSISQQDYGAESVLRALGAEQH